MNPLRSTVLLFGGLAAMPIGCGQADRWFGFQGDPIVNGEPDSNPAHNAVVGILISPGDPEKAGLCSGTLISPRVVLTAAHCTDSPASEDYRVSFGNKVALKNSREVARVWKHPQYSQSGEFNDIAMLRLAEAPPADATPIPNLPSALAITDADVGRPLEYVGFGMTDPLNDRSSGTKMTMTNNLASVCVTWSGCLFDFRFRVPQYTICQDQEPAGVCYGDSGGPALVVREGVEYVAGIASFVLGENCEDYACHAKVDEYEQEISAFLGQQTGTTCSDDESCFSGDCGGGICCEIDCGPCQVCNQPEALGKCRPVADGLACPDESWCNGDETCSSGQCVEGSSRNCDDQNACTIDRCDDSAKICVHIPERDGTSCPDDDVCDGRNSCVGGACREPGPEMALECRDDEPCTTDSCDPQSGCRHEPLPEGFICAGCTGCGPCSKCSLGTCLAEAEEPCDEADPSGCGCGLSLASRPGIGTALGLLVCSLVLLATRNRPRGARRAKDLR